MSSATSPRTIEIVEVSPRDGFQPIVPWIETATKIAFVQRLAAAGLQRIEISAFVSPSAVPQMRDAQAVLAAASIIPGLRVHKCWCRRPGTVASRSLRVRDTSSMSYRYLRDITGTICSERSRNRRRITRC